MQKLVWQNANGVELDLTSGNYGITEWEGFSNASLNIQSQQVPFQDGGVFLDALIEQRELSVTLAMQDNNNLELRYQNRRELISALNPKLGEGYLIYTNDFISKRIKCVPQIPLFETHNSDTAGTPKASLSWTACEPYWEDLEETVVEFSTATECEIINEGDIETQVKIEFANGVENPIIENITNGERIELEGRYLESARINTNTGEKSVKTDVYNFREKISCTFNSIASNGEVCIAVGSGITIIRNVFGNQAEAKSLLAIDGQGFNSVCYKNGVWIAVGNKGLIYISNDKDLENWKKVESGTTNDLKDVCFGLNSWVVVGENGTCLESLNGSEWSVKNTGISETFTSVSFGEINNNKYFVAVANTRDVYFSSNLENWSTNQVAGAGETLTVIRFIEDVFITSGNLNKLYYIRNAPTETWSSSTSTKSGTCTFITSLIFTQQEGDVKYYFICASNGNVIYSENLTSWVGWWSDYFSSSAVNGIAQVDKRSEFVVGAGGFIYKKIESSPSLSYFVKNPAPRKKIKDICSLGEISIAVGTEGLILKSEDNWETYTEILTNISDDIISLSCSEGAFCGITQTGYVVYSTDGETWVSNRITTNRILTKVKFVNGEFLIFGYSGTGTSIISYGWEVSADFVYWGTEQTLLERVIIKDIVMLMDYMYAIAGEYYTSPTSCNCRLWSNSSDLFIPANWHLVKDYTAFKFVQKLEVVDNKVCLLMTSAVSDTATGLIRFNETLSQEESPTTVRYRIFDFIKGENNLMFMAGFDCSLLLATTPPAGAWYFEEMFYSDEADFNCIDYKDGKLILCGFRWDGANNYSYIVTREKSGEENKIQKLSAKSDMRFKLKKGTNVLRFYISNNITSNGVVKIKYSQKYIGV